MITQEEAIALATKKLDELIRECRPEGNTDVMCIASTMLDQVAATLIAASNRKSAALIVIGVLEEIIKFDEPAPATANVATRAAPT